TTPRKVSNASDEEDLVLLVVGGKDGYVQRDGHLVDPERDLERRRAFGGGRPKLPKRAGMSLRRRERDGSRLRVGQVVEVRPAAEILATLDDDVATNALPFMPEMLRFVGRRFSVSAHALKLCDTRSDGTGNRLF